MAFNTPIIASPPSMAWAGRGTKRNRAITNVAKTKNGRERFWERKKNDLNMEIILAFCFVNFISSKLKAQGGNLFYPFLDLALDIWNGHRVRRLIDLHCGHIEALVEHLGEHRCDHAGNDVRDGSGHRDRINGHALDFGDHIFGG